MAAQKTLLLTQGMVSENTAFFKFPSSKLISKLVKIKITTA